MPSPLARVVVLAGPSGSGKTRVADRSGLPVLRLDDFYREGDDPLLPRLDSGVVDWDDPRSWDHVRAVAALTKLCGTGRADTPIYDIAANGKVGHRELLLDGASVVVAEGIFAPEVVADCARRDLLESAICVHHHRLVTFVLRLVRDLREHRKPPALLLRRGWRLLRREPEIVAGAVAAGCRPLSPRAAERELCRLSRSVPRSRA